MAPCPAGAGNQGSVAGQLGGALRGSGQRPARLAPSGATGVPGARTSRHPRVAGSRRAGAGYTAHAASAAGSAGGGPGPRSSSPDSAAAAPGRSPCRDGTPAMEPAAEPRRRQAAGRRGRGCPVALQKPAPDSRAWRRRGPRRPTTRTSRSRPSPFTPAPRSGHRPDPGTRRRRGLRSCRGGARCRARAPGRAWVTQCAPEPAGRSRRPDYPIPLLIGTGTASSPPRSTPSSPPRPSPSCSHRSRPPGERHRRAVDRKPPPRAAGPDPDRQPATTRARPRRLTSTTTTPTGHTAPWTKTRPPAAGTPATRRRPGRRRQRLGGLINEYTYPQVA